MIQSNRLHRKQERIPTRAGGGFGLGQELPDKTQDTQLNQWIIIYISMACAIFYNNKICIVYLKFGFHWASWILCVNLVTPDK